MPVAKTTSPAWDLAAPKEVPSKVVPSSKISLAFDITQKKSPERLNLFQTIFVTTYWHLLNVDSNFF